MDDLTPGPDAIATIVLETVGHCRWKRVRLGPRVEARVGPRARIDRALASIPGLWLGGNSLRGVSVNACVTDAASLAASVVDRLQAVVPVQDPA